MVKDTGRDPGRDQSRDIYKTLDLSLRIGEVLLSRGRVPPTSAPRC